MSRTGSVHASTAAGLSQLYPVGRPITASMKPFSVYQGLNQQGLDAVLLQPVGSQLTQGAREHGACQVADRCQNQKSAVVDYLLQTCLALRITPADPSVPCFHPPGRAGKLQAPNHFTPGPVHIYQILKPCPERHRISQVVVPADKIPEKGPLLSALDPLHIQGVKNSTLPERVL